ncbi:MAG TPA: ABC transporter permease [Vicinamibacterales bacterium]|nr:ABC transporter permease [Vicinamibacterales bacterium]
MTGRRLFRALLRLLPFDFRADYGRELQRTFEDQQRDAPGTAGRARVWAENIAAVVAVGPREHFNQLRQDVTYALRGMRRNIGFVAVAVITLALGTGVNTAIFSIVHAVMLKPLPYAQPETLVTIMNRWDGAAQAGLSDPEYLDYAEQSRSIRIAAMTPGFVTVTGGSGEPARLGSVTASVNVFDVLGRQPALGRGFIPDDERSGSAAVILSDELWRERFGGSPAIIGRGVNIQGTARTVVGVLPPGFVMPVNLVASEAAAVMLPATFDRAASRHQRGGHYLTGIGRLEPGATLASAAAEMDGIVARLARQYPDQHDQGNFGVTLRPLRESVLGDSRPVLGMLTGAVMLVLLLACANVANLMMARGEARRRELSVRAALGASRLRVGRQLVTEALLLSAMATAIGLVVARWALAVVVATGPAALPRLAQVSLSVPVLLFAAGLAVVTTVLFGLLPAFQLSRARPGDALKDGGRGGSAGARAHVRRALVVCQVALAVVLLVGAGLVLKSFARLLSVPGGFDAEHVLTARIAVPAARYPDLAAVSGFFTRLVERLAVVPGVERAGASSGLPLAVGSGDWSFDIEGRARVNGRRPGAADWYAVTPGYFEALSIPVVAGRGPLASDTIASPPVIFINHAAARAIFPGEDPVGRRVQLSRSRGFEQPWRTIAGVVGDVRQRGLDRPARTEIYIPHTQFLHFSPGQQARSMTVVLRSRIAPEQLMSAVRGELRGLDPEIPLADARPMTEVMALSVADRRLNVLLLGTFALLAIVLATVGVYGVIAYDVLHRTREIGIRVALGASRSSILALMLLQGMKLVLLGGVIGIAAAAAITGSMSQLLFEVGPRDAAVFASVAVLLAGAGAAASYVPAWRAARVDPLHALRRE